MFQDIPHRRIMGLSFDFGVCFVPHSQILVCISSAYPVKDYLVIHMIMTKCKMKTDFKC